MIVTHTNTNKEGNNMLLGQYTAINFFSNSFSSASSSNVCSSSFSSPPPHHSNFRVLSRFCLFVFFSSSSSSSASFSSLVPVSCFTHYLAKRTKEAIHSFIRLFIHSFILFL